jgi:carbon starvation protein CstA
MLMFFTSVGLLILGYFIYGRFVDRLFGSDPARKTPAETLEDGVDYVKMAPWKIFLIQLLNIAGLGPIYGAILGALYGPVALVWIVLGCIFAGAVHLLFSHHHAGGQDHRPHLPAVRSCPHFYGGRHDQHAHDKRL